MQVYQASELILMAMDHMCMQVSILYTQEYTYSAYAHNDIVVLLVYL